MSRGRRAVGLVVAGLALGAVACAGGSGSEVKGTGAESPVDPVAAEAATAPLYALAVDLAQELAGGDAVVAPLPVAVSLSQARSGAVGSTAEAIDRVLHTPPDGDAEQLARGLSSLERILATRSGEQRAASTRTGTVAIDLTQSLWLQEGTTIDEAWLDGLATTWGGGVRTTDFRSDPESARKAVNTWAADTTHDHIDQVAPRGSIPPSTRLLAAGAAYLKAPWVTPFAETDSRLLPFHHLDGSTTTTAMMRNPHLDDVRHGSGDGWVAVDIPYLGRSLWMTIVVPDAGRFSAVERGLDGASLQQLVDSLRPATVDLTIPEFAFTTDVPLTDALRSLGLTEAMDPFTADFGRISPEVLALTSVLHQTYLAIGEEGTEATGTAPKAPATTTSTRRTADTPGTAGTPDTTPPAVPSSAEPSVADVGTTVVRADRPFLVLVRDRPTGAPLFYGRVLSPNG